MECFVISLTKAHERRVHIQQEFGKQNIDFQFFDALTPDLALPFSQQLGLNFNSDILTQGELACFMSHVSIWKKMIDENIPYAAVFEDDVFLGEDAGRLLKETAWIKPDWHIIKTEAFAERVFLTGQAEKLSECEREIVQLAGKNLGTAGYILSLKGAQAYFEYVKRIELIPLDHVMFDQFIEQKVMPVYQVKPALCIQEMMLHPEKNTVLSSELFTERRARMKKMKKKGFAKLMVEIARIFTQIQYAMKGKSVPFK